VQNSRRLDGSLRVYRKLKLNNTMKNRREEIELYLSKLRCQESELECEVTQVKIDSDVSKIIMRLEKCRELVKKFENELKKIDLNSDSSIDNDQETVNYTKKNNAYLKVRRIYPILNI